MTHPLPDTTRADIAREVTQTLNEMRDISNERRIAELRLEPDSNTEYRQAMSDYIDCEGE